MSSAARDIAIQRHEATKGPVGERRALDDALIAFRRSLADEGLFLWLRGLEAERHDR